MKLYVRAKLAGNFDKWHETSVATHPETTHNFTNFNFMIDNVVYRDDTPDWREAFNRLQVWAKLHE